MNRLALVAGFLALAAGLGPAGWVEARSGSERIGQGGPMMQRERSGAGSFSSERGVQRREMSQSGALERQQTGDRIQERQRLRDPSLHEEGVPAGPGEPKNSNARDRQRLRDPQLHDPAAEPAKPAEPNAPGEPATPAQPAVPPVDVN